MGKKSPPPENGRVDTFETLNVTLNSLSFVLQELLSAYRADLKRARVAGWVGLTVIIRLISVQLD